MDRYQFERQLWQQGYKRVMGLDEVGRGCLCGPVVAAGVILTPGSALSEKIADSKTIDLKNREWLAEEIKENANYWVIKECSPEVIDELNILKASIQAMMQCSEAEGANPDYLLVDGNRFTNSLIPHSCIVKGDNKSVSIAAASILAKVYRDRYMKQLHEVYPVFGWDKNVGYPTKQHVAGLKKHGYTKHHRKSFKLGTVKRFGE
jgi:ribonuclease HII